MTTEHSVYIMVRDPLRPSRYQVIGSTLTALEASHYLGPVFSRAPNDPDGTAALSRAQADCDRVNAGLAPWAADDADRRAEDAHNEAEAEQSAADYEASSARRRPPIMERARPEPPKRRGRRLRAVPPSPAAPSKRVRNRNSETLTVVLRGVTVTLAVTRGNLLELAASPDDMAWLTQIIMAFKERLQEETL